MLNFIFPPKPIKYRLIFTLTFIVCFVSSVYSQGDDCTDALDLCTITSPYSSTTTGKNNDFTIDFGSSSEDMIFYIDLPNGASITIGQTVNSYDSKHELRYGLPTGACPGATKIVSDDDPDIQNHSWTNSTGVTQRVYWLQGGWSTSDGAFTLGWTVTGSPCTPPTCNDPSMQTAGNIGPTSVDLGWTENGTATIWDIELGLAGFGPTGAPTASGVTNNPHTYTGLSPSTSYDYYVRADCGSLQSNWIGPFNFTTTACNVQNPSLLTATNVFSISADLGWTENGNSSVWDIELGAVGFSPTGTPTANNVTTNPYTYTGLSPSTSYDYYVRADCGGANSGWIGPFNFTTSSFPTNYTSEITSGWARDVVQGLDGNYVYAGSANSDILVAKTTQGGNIIWKKTYGGASTDKAYNIVNSGDGGYVILSETQSTTLNVSGISGDYDLLITKLDANGVHVWSRAIGRSGSSNDDRGVYDADLIRNTDGTYAVIANSYDSGDDMAFIHLSSTGIVLAAKALNTQNAYGYALAKASGTNTGWVTAGHIKVSGNDEFFVVKLKQDYTEDWSMRWGDNTSSGEEIFAIVENSADDYTVFGRTSAEGATPTNMYAMRFTKAGAGAYTVVWEKAYGTASSSYIKDAVVAADGNYIVTGYCSDGGAYVNTYLMRIDAATGAIIWQTDKPDDGSGNRQGEGVFIESSGCYLVAGLGGFDMLKFAPDGTICDGVPGSATTTDLGTTIANVDLTEAWVRDVFAVANASKTLSITNPDFGTFLTSCNLVLPVKLISFDVTCDNNRALCEWVTSTEINNDYFTIERSIDGTNFEEIGTVLGYGNSNTERYYRFVDDFPLSEVAYYRLKQTDFDGKDEYFEIKASNCKSEEEFTLYPNPFNNYIELVFEGPSKLEYKIEIKNYLGQIVFTKVLPRLSTKVKLEIDSRIIKGVYFLQLFDNNGIKITKKIVKL
jgi:hypothetical protein